MTIRCKALLTALILMLAPLGTAEEDARTLPAHELPEGFCYLHEAIPDIILDMRYAGTHNFVGDVIDGYEAPYAILTRAAADKLRNAADQFRQMGYRIMVFDAYRPQRAVKHFQRWARDGEDTRMQAEFYPEIKKKQTLLDEEYIASNSAHCRGSAIDMTLTDLEGTPLDMGTGFDYFGKLSWHGAAGITEEQEGNRLLLKTVMEENGFRSFQKEWWHYKLLGEPFQTAFDFPVR